MRLVRRFAVTIVGVALLVVGAALMVLPGPGILLIVAGLAVLATEYVWAHHLLVRAREQAGKAQQAAVASPVRTGGSVLFALATLGLGVVMLVVDDMAWPVLDSLLDRLWGPVTGAVVVVTSLILLTTTYLTIRSGKGEATTYTEHTGDGPGATRLDAR